MITGIDVDQPRENTKLFKNSKIETKFQEESEGVMDLGMV